MKNILRIEEVAFFVIGLYGFSLLPYDWWVLAALFFVPDSSMIGYLWNPKTGAIIYNLFHHRGLAILVILIGLIFNYNLVILTGLTLFLHSTFDRMVGYGLKHSDSFKHTHLENIGFDY